MSPQIEKPAWYPQRVDRWTYCRLKSAVESIDSGVWGDDTYDDADSTPVLRSNEIDEGGTWRVTEPARRLLSMADRRKALLREGDLLLVKSSGSAAHIGKTAAVTRQIEDLGCCYSNFTSRIRVRSHSTHARFLWYYLNNTPGRDQLFYHGTTTTGLINLSATTIGICRLALPPLPEQVRIAAYLDASCAAIDAAVAAKQRQIETLHSLMISTITVAVARGTTLVTTLKPSGEKWLGDIPSHWEMKRIKDIADLRSGEGIASEDISPIGDFPVYGGNGLRGYTSSFTHDGQFPLIGRQGALCGNINYANGKFWATEHAVVVTPRRPHNTLWIGELLRVMNLNQYSNAAAQPGLAVERLKFLRLPVPPCEEQTAIAQHIARAIQRTDELKHLLDKQITLLLAYRKSLIHECVTGQRRITEADLKRAQAHG